MANVESIADSPIDAGDPTTNVEADPQSREFENLVAEHSPMVLGVCRRILGGSEVEDAAQAVFILLWQKFRQVAASSNVSGWLHRTAYHVCRNALRSRSIRSKHERKAASEMTSMCRDLSENEAWNGVREILDQEIDRLPEKWRVPFVLFHLESRSLADVAAVVGAPVPTVGTWLQRSREQLANRLRRRGIVIGAAALTTLLSQQAMANAVPEAFVATTVQVALGYSASNAAASAVCSVTTNALVRASLAAGAAKKMWVTFALVCCVVAGFPLSTYWLFPMLQTRFSADFSKLQGRWQAASSGQFADGTPFTYTDYLVISGRTFDRYQTLSDGRRIQGEQGTFVLDDSRRPKQIDISRWFASAPGIYEVDGQALTICVAANGVRPGSVPGESDSDLRVTRYTRAE